MVWVRLTAPSVKHTYGKGVPSDHTRTILKSTFLPKLQALVDQHVFFGGSLFLYPLKRGRMEKGIIYFTAPPSSPPPCVAPPHCPPPSTRIVSWLPLAHVQMVLSGTKVARPSMYTPASPYCLWRGATVTYPNPLIFFISPVRYICPPVESTVQGKKEKQGLQQQYINGELMYSIFIYKNKNEKKRCVGGV
jgi:hypothetical protein